MSTLIFFNFEDIVSFLTQLPDGWQVDMPVGLVMVDITTP